MTAVSPKPFFENHFFDLVLKKHVSIVFSRFNCFVELMDEGKTLCLHSVLYENTRGIEDAFLEEIATLETRGLAVDRKCGQVLMARKYSFEGMSPEAFALRMAQFFSEIQGVRKEMDAFLRKEPVFISKK